MMLRRLFWLLALLLLWTFVSRLFRKASAPATEARPSTPRFEGAMVRDRVCETFLPRSQALSLRSGGEEHYFCSEDCRSRFLSGRRALR